MHGQNARSMRLLGWWPCGFFRAAVAGLDRAPMKPPRFDFSWPEDVQALHRHDMRDIWDSSIAPQIWNQHHNQLDLYRRIGSGLGRLDILDVGCAQGTLALLLAEDGHNVCAMDIRQQFLDYAISRYDKGDVRFVCANAMEGEIDGRYDLIFANQIIEHLVYPLDLVRRLAAQLKPGGRLVMTTPNGGYLKNSLPSFNALGERAYIEDDVWLKIIEDEAKPCSGSYTFMGRGTQFDISCTTCVVRSGPP